MFEYKLKTENLTVAFISAFIRSTVQSLVNLRFTLISGSTYSKPLHQVSHN